ncbi:hypothetical protein PV762_25920 [Mitsuaria sp. CC2]|jgi:hypothetical protein|uniref:hypothetical protein n=1 Tax=Mitsuaria sp. CC2 TaxID=3029186 RepID=UPI003B8E6AE5
MNLSVGSPPYELLLLSEARVEEIAGRIEQQPAITPDEFYTLVDSQKIDVYRCPQCDRVHIDQGEGKFASYKREVSE